MIFTQLLTAATTLAGMTTALPHNVRGVAPSGNTGGGVTIYNNISQDLYLWSVGEDANKMITVPQGETYSEDWRINPNGGGISIKISTDPNQNDVLQYEYTLAEPKIFWDLSCIDMGTGSLFSEVGFDVTSNSDQCENATCKPGDTQCSAAYLVPSDNHATHGCPQSTNMILNIGPSDAEY